MTPLEMFEICRCNLAVFNDYIFYVGVILFLQNNGSERFPLLPLVNFRINILHFSQMLT